MSPAGWMFYCIGLMLLFDFGCGFVCVCLLDEPEDRSDE